MLFKDQMWIRYPRLRVRPMGAINLAPTIGGVNAAPTMGRGQIYRAHAPAPFMGEGSPWTDDRQHDPAKPLYETSISYHPVPR
jgi:hypothetical protein